MWIDEKQVNVGDSISASIEDALTTSDFFCLILSNSSAKRPWVQREYRAALTLQLSTEGQRPRILPIVIDDVSLPALLRDIRFADFCSSYATGFEQRCRSVGVRVKPAPFLGLADLFGTPDQLSMNSFGFLRGNYEPS